MKEKEVQLKEEHDKQRKVPKKKGKKRETTDEKRDEELVRINEKIFQKIPHKVSIKNHYPNDIKRIFKL